MKYGIYRNSDDWIPVVSCSRLKDAYAQKLNWEEAAGGKFIIKGDNGHVEKEIPENLLDNAKRDAVILKTKEASEYWYFMVIDENGYKRYLAENYI